MRFAVFGAGFWAPYQLAAWGEVPGARCVALYNRTPARAENLAQGHGVPAVFDDPERLLCETQPDFVDVITAVETHAQFVRLAAAHGIPVVCQKPMATSLAEAESMVDTCRRELALAGASPPPQVRARLRRHRHTVSGPP